MAEMAAMGLDVVGAGVKAFGSMYGGKAQKQMYDYQAATLQAQAAAATQVANKLDIPAGEVRAQQAGMVGRAAVGRTLVRAGAGNVSTTMGSTAGVVRSQEAIAMQNEGIERANAARAAYGEEFRAAQMTSQAGVDIFAGKTAQTASYIDMASSIVGGASGVADKWYAGSLYQS